jgi:hypothetical protein
MLNLQSWAVETPSDIRGPEVQMLITIVAIVVVLFVAVRLAMRIYFPPET